MTTPFQTFLNDHPDLSIEDLDAFIMNLGDESETVEEENACLYEVLAWATRELTEGNSYDATSIDAVFEGGDDVRFTVQGAPFLVEEALRDFGRRGRNHQPSGFQVEELLNHAAVFFSGSGDRQCLEPVFTRHTKKSKLDAQLLLDDDGSVTLSARSSREGREDFRLEMETRPARWTFSVDGTVFVSRQRRVTSQDLVGSFGPLLDQELFILSWEEGEAPVEIDLEVSNIFTRHRPDVPVGEESKTSAGSETSKDPS